METITKTKSEIQQPVEWTCQRCRTKTTERPREHVCKAEEPEIRHYISIRRIDFEHYGVETLDVVQASDTDQKKGIWGRVVKPPRNLFGDESAGEPYDIAIETIQTNVVQELGWVQTVEKCEHGLWVEATCPDCLKCRHDVPLSGRCVPCKRLGVLK